MTPAHRVVMGDGSVSFEMRDLPPWLIAGVSLSSFIGMLLFGFLRARFSGDFARASDMAALGVRVQAVETRIATMPDHADIRNLAARVGAVESGVAVMTEKARGIEQSLGRVERSVDLLVQHQLEETKG